MSGSRGTGAADADTTKIYPIYERRGGKNLTITEKNDMTGGFYEDGTAVYETV